MPYVRSLVVVEKTSRDSQGQETDSSRYYLSSLDVRTKASRFGELIRGHWGGCENRNHWVRDHLLREDDTRSKNWNLNANLAVARAAVVHVKGNLLPEDSWPVTIEKAFRKTSFAFQLVVNHKAK